MLLCWINKVSISPLHHPLSVIFHVKFMKTSLTAIGGLLIRKIYRYTALRFYFLQIVVIKRISGKFILFMYFVLSKIESGYTGLVQFYLCVINHWYAFSYNIVLITNYIIYIINIYKVREAIFAFRQSMQVFIINNKVKVTSKYYC